jgi:hypothetical protein
MSHVAAIATGNSPSSVPDAIRAFAGQINDV